MNDQLIKIRNLAINALAWNFRILGSKYRIQKKTIFTPWKLKISYSTPKYITLLNMFTVANIIKLGELKTCSLG